MRSRTARPTRANARAVSRAGWALVSAALTLLAGSYVAEAALAQGAWRLEQPPPPPGATFKAPLGPPGDLKCWARNRCLLGVEGNATIPRGLFSWDGANWHQLSTVCGGPGDTMRIAFAGPREFWTVTEPSQPRFGAGKSLCRFKDGAVVASYSTPAQSPDPYHQMNAAVCLAPSDCWFGGVGAQDPTGDRIGAFHLHWDGSSLVSVYNNGNQRGVSDLEAHQGVVWESVFVGKRAEDASGDVRVEPPEDRPRLLHRITGGLFANDPFVPMDRPGVPAAGNELLTLDSDGSQLWAGGGGAASGPAVPTAGEPPQPDPPVRREPLAARFVAGTWQAIDYPDALFGSTERFRDLAAVSGTDYAWVAVQPFAERSSVNSKAKVARLRADGTAETVRLPVAGAGRGSAARIEFSGPNDGWLVTQAGWLFHYTDGSSPETDTDPAYQGTITFRPNEAAEQFVPDTAPADDSQLFAPPPVEVEQEQRPPRTRRIRALIRRVRARMRGNVLTVSFILSRRAKVALLARRGSRVVARTSLRTMRPGRRALRLKLDRQRWPTRLSFRTRELTRRPGGGS
jgi:hypothetical protein